MTAKKTKKSTPWFPPSPDRDHLERVLVVLVRSWESDTQIAKAFERFVASGYKRALLTGKLYLALTRTFGFIAHFDRDGFYEARFGSPAARADTLTIMATDSVDHPLTDLERRLRTMVVARELAEAAMQDLAADTEQRERAELARLKAKYEVDPLSLGG